VGNVGSFVSIVALISGIIFFELDDISKYVKKCLKYLLISVAIIFVSTLIPSQKTIYTMMIGSQLTTKNIELVGGTVKSTMDYMFDKTEGLIKSAKDSK
jgi:diacylglycerol kinase